MRGRVFAVLVALTMGFSASAQGPPASSFVAKLKHMKVDLSNGVSGTCLAVFPDGRFHMEETWQSLPLGPSGSRIYEDLLPKEALESLQAILEAPGLKELKDANRGWVSVDRGAVFAAVIPRGEKNQGFAFFTPFPGALTPLVQWFQSTTNALHQRKLHPLRHEKPANCRLAGP